MKSNLAELDENELAVMIESAQRLLRDRQDGKRKEGIVKIKEIAASIGVTVEITEPGRSMVRKGGKVAVKYQNPANPADKWTGRGMKPKWLREMIEQGRSLEEFAI
jgi:DNA-binding protein H-NS